MKEKAGSYQFFFEVATDGMLFADGAGSILDANPAALRLLGRDELAGASFDGLFDPIDVRLEPARKELRETGRFDGYLLVNRADGTCFTAEVSLRANGDGDARDVSMVFRSPGERERFGEPSEDGGEARFRALVHGSPDLVLLVTPDGEITYVSPTVERLHGFVPEEVEGKNLLDFIHPEDRERSAQDLAWKAMNPGTVGLPGPVARVRHKDGSWRVVQAFVSNHLDDPNVGALLFSSRNLTERVRLEEELKASEERFRALVENAQDFVVLADENNVARYVSPAIEQILGYSPEEFVDTVGACGPGGRHRRAARQCHVRGAGRVG